MQKYNVGDEARITNGNYKGLPVKIEGIVRSFKVVDENGQFVKDGLVTFEDNISSIQIPYTFDGETLTVEFEERRYVNSVEKAHKTTSKVYEYYYDLRALNKDKIWHLIRISERDIEPLTQP